MPRFAAFLRAVNVGGTGKLPMQNLREMCEICGLTDLKTYIASGNVAFTSGLPSPEIASRLETALERFAGKPVGVFIRSHAQLSVIADQNPFADAMGNKVTAILIDNNSNDALEAGTKGLADEEIAEGDGCIYVHYPSGMGTSKLKLLGAQTGTARNMNTIAKMRALTA